ncbi:class II aldolase/adducin family protein [Puniceibacterium sp. IMCC21224]|uniref:class II aldolase/adducin family protein n=1 Tax=Puniceibacterium sp. IMCC21224 TaxID=1618204 RepID=UPI00064D800B|nr:class II aldolase/adducin family protein [Puniceibacterium sp. IMCC21224]KMK64999.1 ribulose-5-phosphate 4-epimerase-like epimerase or aldolase [Puniceibacterium sp. IMCC21224]
MSDTKDPKAELALCLRMLERGGIIDYNGHASIRAGRDRMFINVGSAQRSRLTAADICTVDLDGNLLEGAGNPPLEFHLHAGIYKARPEVDAVIHAHPQWSTYLSMTGHPYAPVFAQGALLYPVPVLDTPDSINSPEMSARLVCALTDRPAALMKSHGAVTVGGDITEAFVLMTYLEENARRQYMALQIGQPYSFSHVECAAAKTKLRNAKLFQRTWDHFAAKLEDRT